MTTYNFRAAAASEAKPLIGLYAESGTGKTYGALLLAAGFVREMGATMADVGMIETESGRGEAYADDPVVGGYKVLPLRRDFSPAAYGKAIAAAEDAKLLALIVDSASHEWEGTGGVLDMAAKNQEAGKKGVLVWQQPKIEHKREFVLRMTQSPIPLVIVCMRAKFAMEEVEKNGRKEWVRSKALTPTQADDILHEMFVHGWTDHEHRLHVTKYTGTPDQISALRDVFPPEPQRISITTGERLAAWARHRALEGKSKAAPQQAPGSSGVDGLTSSLAPPAAAAAPNPQAEQQLADWCAALEAADTLDALRDQYEKASEAVGPWASDVQLQLIVKSKNKRGRELTTGGRSA